MPRIRYFPHLLIAVLIVLGASGCGRASLHMSARGWEPLHRNAEGESTPVDVRIYQLRVAEPFIHAPFEDLWLDGEKVLAGSQVGELRVATIYPTLNADAVQRIHGGRLHSDANYIGIMALYRRADNPDQRRLVLRRRDIRERPLLHFHGFSVSLEAPTSAGED